VLPKDMLPKDTMDVKEVARYLAMDEKTVAAMAAERRIPALEHEGKWLFSKKSIDKWRGRSITQ
jgi:excisionase family DNA binding protein